MEHFKYIKIPFFWIPKKTRTQYKPYYIVEPDGYVYCEVRKGVYGLKQADRLAFDNLVKLLDPTAIYLSNNIPVYGNIRPNP